MLLPDWTKKPWTPRRRSRDKAPYPYKNRGPILQVSIRRKLERRPQSCILDRLPLELRQEIYTLCIDVSELKVSKLQPLIEALRPCKDLYMGLLDWYYQRTFVRITPPHNIRMIDWWKDKHDVLFWRKELPQAHEKLLELAPESLSMIRTIQLHRYENQLPSPLDLANQVKQ